MKQVVVIECLLISLITSQMQAPAAAPASASASAPADVRSDPLPGTNTAFAPARYKTLQEWQVRRNWLRDQVRLAAGLLPDAPRAPVQAQIFGKIVRDGYTVEKVFFPSSPGMYVTGNLYRPLSADRKCPAVACPHGHWANGRLHHEALGSIPARCITLARNGAVAFAYDMVGYNDSARTFKHGDKHLDTPKTALWGLGHLQLQTFNSVRVIDFLQSLPDVDPKRIGVTGASGGGTQTFILGAVDDRVAVDCPVNMISSTMQGGCVCENAPLLRIDTNNMEIAATFAPRTRLMVSATGDWTKLTPSVEFPFMRSIYELYGQADHLVNVHIDAPHNYNLQSRQAMYAFFGKWLLDNPHPESIKEGAIPVEKPEDLLVFNDTNVPAHLAGPEQVIELGTQQIKERMAQYRPTDRAKLEQLTGLIRLWLEHAVGSSWPTMDEISVRRERTVYYRVGISEFHEIRTRHGRSIRETRRVGVRPLSTEGKIRHVAIHTVPADLIPSVRSGDTSASHEEGSSWNLGLCEYDVIETFGTRDHKGDSATQPTGDHKFFTTFNRTDTAEAVYDIITALAAMGGEDVPEQPPVHITLVGPGRMGPVCLLARAMVPEEFAKKHNLRVVANVNGFDTSADSSYVDQLFVPQIQRFGGLPAIAAVASTTPLWLHNTDGVFDSSWVEDATKLTGSELRIDEEPARAKDLIAWITKQD